MSADDENTGSGGYPTAIVPHIGTEVTGDKFFPRKALEAEFDSAMTRTNGAKLFGLRRIGKVTVQPPHPNPPPQGGRELLQHSYFACSPSPRGRGLGGGGERLLGKSSEAAACCERLREAGFIVVREDAQGMTSEVVLLHAILRQLPTKGLQARALKLIGEDNAIAKAARDMMTKATGGKPEDVLAYFGPIMAAVETAIDQSEHVALVIDEFPWLCRSILQGDAAKGTARVDVLLAALRRWRSKGMRMLLMGSIGMVALSRQYHLDLNHLTDLGLLHVPPFEPDEARALVDALAKGGRIAGWTEAHTAALLEETVAFYPAMLQKGFEQTTFKGVAARVERFPDLFAEKVRPDFDDTYYQQFDKRRKLYRDLPEPLPDLLEGALLAVMKADGPVARDELHETLGQGDAVSEADLGDALNILREDGFLAVRAQRDGSQQWRVASDLIRAWWNQRRGGSRR